jgi:hypothetical protein
MCVSILIDQESYSTLMMNLTPQKSVLPTLNAQRVE